MKKKKNEEFITMKAGDLKALLNTLPDDADVTPTVDNDGIHLAVSHNSSTCECDDTCNDCEAKKFRESLSPRVKRDYSRMLDLNEECANAVGDFARDVALNVLDYLAESIIHISKSAQDDTEEKIMCRIVEDI